MITHSQHDHIPSQESNWEAEHLEEQPPVKAKAATVVVRSAKLEDADISIEKCKKKYKAGMLATSWLSATLLDLFILFTIVSRV